MMTEDEERFIDGFDVQWAFPDCFAYIIIHNSGKFQG